MPVSYTHLDVYKRQVCGFVEEFDGEELPADFKCPQCGVSGDRFTKVEEGKMTWAAEHIVRCV